MTRYLVILSLIFAFNSFAKDCGLMGNLQQRTSDCSHVKSQNNNFVVLTSIGSEQFLLEKDTTIAWSPVIKNYLKCKRPYKRPKKKDLTRINSKGLKVDKSNKRCMANLKGYYLIDFQEMSFEN